MADGVVTPRTVTVTLAIGVRSDGSYFVFGLSGMPPQILGTLVAQAIAPGGQRGSVLVQEVEVERPSIIEAVAG